MTNYAWIKDQWKPLATKPREIRRGRNKGRLEVGIFKLGSAGFKICKCIIEQGDIRGQGVSVLHELPGALKEPLRFGNRNQLDALMETENRQAPGNRRPITAGGRDPRRPAPQLQLSLFKVQI